MSLTELIEKKYLERLDLSVNTKNLIRKHYEALDQQDRTKFDTLYSKADIHFEFSEDSTLNKRKIILKKAFKLLLEQLDSDSTFCIEYHSDLMPILSKILIYKCDLKGPLFAVPSYIRLGDPIKETISKKLLGSEKYEVSSPITLLTYIDRYFSPNRDLLKHFVKLASRHSRKSKFQKIIVFSVKEKKVLFEYPTEY